MADSHTWPADVLHYFLWAILENFKNPSIWLVERMCACVFLMCPLLSLFRSGWAYTLSNVKKWSSWLYKVHVQIGIAIEHELFFLYSIYCKSLISSWLDQVLLLLDLLLLRFCMFYYYFSMFEKYCSLIHGLNCWSLKIIAFLNTEFAWKTEQYKNYQ